MVQAGFAPLADDLSDRWQYPAWLQGAEWEDITPNGLAKEHQYAELAMKCAQLMRTVEEKESARLSLSIQLQHQKELADLSLQHQKESEALRQQLNQYQNSQARGAMAGPKLLADAWEEREDFCNRLMQECREKDMRCAELEENCAKLDKHCANLDERYTKKCEECKEMAQSALDRETRCLELQEECKVRAHNQRVLEERCEELSRRCLEMERRAASVVKSFCSEGQDPEIKNIQSNGGDLITDLALAVELAGVRHGELTAKCTHLTQDLKLAHCKGSPEDDYQELERRCQEEAAPRVQDDYHAHARNALEWRSEIQEFQLRFREEAEICQSLERLRVEEVEERRAELSILESQVQDRHQECIAIKRRLFEQEEDSVALERTCHEEERRCKEYHSEYQRQKLRCSHLVREFGETERHWSGRCAELEASLSARHRVAEAKCDALEDRCQSDAQSNKALSVNLRAAEASVDEASGSVREIQKQQGLEAMTDTQKIYHVLRGRLRGDLP